MADRELLEAAAKAAGIALVQMSDGALYFADNTLGNEFNPLADDGDALRLAVKLHMTLRCYMGNTCAQIGVPGQPAVYVYESNHADHMAATRRAIVRAAAALGRLP